jgi:hypothetical protein
MWREWSASRSTRITGSQRRRYPLKRRFGGRATLDDLEERELSAPAEIQTPDRPSCSLVAVPWSFPPIFSTSHSFILGGCGAMVLSALYRHPTVTWIFSRPRGPAAPGGPGPPHRCFTITLGRAPLDEWPAHRRDPCMTALNTYKSKTSMPSAGFEPAIHARERP